MADNKKNSETEDFLFSINLKNFDWKKNQYIIILLVFIILSIVFSFLLYKDLKYLPSPIYGGDIYYHNGIILNIYKFHLPFFSSAFLGEYEHYPWLFHFIAAVFSHFFVNLFTGEKYFVIFMPVFTVIIGYFIGFYLTKKKEYGLLFAGIWAFWGLNFVPSLGPTGFNIAVFIPLTFLLVSYFLEKEKYWLVSLILGLSSIMHTYTFLGMNAFVFLYILISKDNKKWKRLLNLLKYYPIAVVLSLLYFFGPLFVYHLKTPNNWQDYVASGSNIPFFEFIKGLFYNFFNFSSVIYCIISALVALGLFTIFYTKKRKIIALIVVAILGFIHPILTLPLLHMSVGFYGFANFFVIIRGMCILFGLVFLIKLLKIEKKLVLYGLSFVMFFLISIPNLNAGMNDQYIKSNSQKSDFYDTYYSLTDTFQNVNDVFISSNDETAFAVYSVTGMKTVFLRRTHASPYVDINERIKDGALIMYGNSLEKSKQLLKKYVVKYYVEDGYSIQSNQECLKEFESVIENSTFDNLYCLMTSPEYESELRKAGIETRKIKTRLDPASIQAPRFDMIMIKPKVSNNLMNLSKNVYKNSYLFVNQVEI